MNIGYKKQDDIVVCINCGQAVGKGDKPLVNYCPNCASPMNMQSAAETEKTQLQLKLELLNEIMQEVDDDNADCLSVVKRSIEELKESMK